MKLQKSGKDSTKNSKCPPRPGSVTNALHTHCIPCPPSPPSVSLTRRPTFSDRLRLSLQMSLLNMPMLSHKDSAVLRAATAPPPKAGREHRGDATCRPAPALPRAPSSWPRPRSGLLGHMSVGDSASVSPRPLCPCRLWRAQAGHPGVCDSSCAL